jgi:hypothetical protein
VRTRARSHPRSINPFTAFMTGGQLGLVNIKLGQSGDPAIEADVLSDVATYGKQLGRIGDALAVLIAHFHPRRRSTRRRRRRSTRSRRCSTRSRT